MGRYCYVRLDNQLFYRDDDGNYNKTETGKELERIVTSVPLGYSEPSALAVVGVRWKTI